MPTTITPSQPIIKSANVIRKPYHMDDVVMTNMSPKKLIPTSKARRLIMVVQVKCTKHLPCAGDVSTKDKYTTSSSSDESERYHCSDKYSKPHLYDK